MARQNAVTKEEAGRYDPRLEHEHFKAEESVEARAHDGQFERRRAANEPAVNDPHFAKSEDSNAARGIQNVSVYSEEVPDEIARKTVGRRFIDEDSVQAHARNKDKDSTKRGTASNDPQYAMSRAEQVRDRFRRIGQIAQKGKGMRTLSKRLMWYEISISGIIFLWQFFFGIFAIIGFGMHASIKDNFLGKFVSLFVNLDSVSPALYLGYMMMTLGMLLSFGAFVSYMLWYQLTGVRVFKTTLNYLTTFSCFFASFMPILSIFPWFPIWVCYVNVRKLFNRA